jgi:hypothetical protein
MATPDRPTFDQTVIDKLREAVQSIILETPEVKTVSATVCWQGDLNNAKILHGVWIGANGVVSQADEIFGSAWQTMRMLKEQVNRAEEMLTWLQDRFQALAAEVPRHEQAKEEAKEGSTRGPG